MAVRVNETEVKDILGRHYDTKRSASLSPFIKAANLLTNRVATCAIAKGTLLTSDELKEIERWLSGHFYERSDPMFSSKTTAGASASYQGQTTMHLESTFYGQTAMDLDTSGCLSAFNKRAVAGGFWAGQEATEETTWSDRNE